ncbi:unnamed protein product [Phytophthora fragariaefolia]|uniref:Unnamed protein product n=1 Tax=Phytophthora fragariaefolia TaxID=1490495 RepID=A0A9W6X1N0_9STRA|nr:unnamed protein product [Phytophthora fragariaefolia]
MDHPESIPDGQSSNKQPSQDKTCDGAPGIHSYVNRVLDKVAERAGVSERLASHSFRRGGAQHADGAGMWVQWIFDRGAWNMTATNKAFAYVLNTPSEDHKVVRVLSSRHPDQVVALLSLDSLDSATQAKIRFVAEPLFAASVGLETAQYNGNGRRLEACAVEKGFTVSTLLSSSSHLVCDPNTSFAPKPGESQEPATDITQTPLFRHQAALVEQLIEVNQNLDARMTTMEDAFYSRQQRKRKYNDAGESITSEAPAKRKRTTSAPTSLKDLRAALTMNATIASTGHLPEALEVIFASLADRCKRRIELKDIREWISAPGPSTEANDEAEWSTENDLSEQPMRAVRKVFDHRRLNLKTYYLVEKEPTWEPREHLAQTLIAGFERERRAVVRKVYIWFEAVEDNTLNRTEGKSESKE